MKITTIPVFLLAFSSLFAQDEELPRKFLVTAQSVRTQEAPPVWAPLSFLLGDWVGDGRGTPGQGTGGFSFQWDLQKAVLIRKSQAHYAATKDRPAYSHEDLMVVYKEASPERLRAIYFDNEGHVINYEVTSQHENKVEFLSEVTPSTPRFRLTYIKTGTGLLTLKFEIAPPGKPSSFSTYIEASARKQSNVDR